MPTELFLVARGGYGAAGRLDTEMSRRPYVTAAVLVILLNSMVAAAGQVAACESARAEAEVTPTDEFAWINLGRCYLSQDFVDEAIAAFRRAIEVAPNNILAYDNLGIAYVRKGLLQEAEVLYRRVEEHGLQTRDHELLADHYLEQGELEKAEVEYRHTIALGYYDAGTMDRYREIGLRYLATGKPEPAGRILQQVFDLRPTDEQALEALQRILYARGKGDEAEILQLRYLIAVYDTRYAIASARLRDERIATRIQLAQLYIKIGQVDLAQRILEDAVDLNYDINITLAVPARLLLGTVYCRRGRLQDAVAQWERVLKLDPTSAEAQSNLARARQEGCVGNP